MISNDAHVGWERLSAESFKQVPATVGVYEIADNERVVVDIGYGGGDSLFGLRGAIALWLETEGTWWFCYEVTTGYLSRFYELAMVYKSMQGRLPRELEARGVLIPGTLQP